MPVDSKIGHWQSGDFSRESGISRFLDFLLEVFRVLETKGSGRSRAWIWSLCLELKIREYNSKYTKWNQKLDLTETERPAAHRKESQGRDKRDGKTWSCSEAWLIPRTQILQTLPVRGAGGQMTQPPLSPKDQMPQSQYCIQFLFFWYQKKAQQLKTLQHLPLELATRVRSRQPGPGLEPIDLHIPGKPPNVRVWESRNNPRQIQCLSKPKIYVEKLLSEHQCGSRVWGPD